MNPEKPSPVETKNDTARFYLIFDELAKAENQDALSAANLDEIEEIEQVRRMVVDVNDEPLRFMTST